MLSSDRRLAVKRFELAQVDEQIAAQISRWQVLALTHHWLVQLKEHYEKHRQPETLREASEYLSRLTSGRYRRVWTRWGENVLLVDDAHAGTLPIEVLSRGTREQLFLSLRLALVGLFARRGVELPMVLDDVLVNFDVERATAAVHVLHEFARRGHQLIIFTCHEHLARLFKTNQADVRRLPTDHQSSHDEPFTVEMSLPPRRIRTRKPKDDIEPSPPLVVDMVPPSSAARTTDNSPTNNSAPHRFTSAVGPGFSTDATLGLLAGRRRTISASQCHGLKPYRRHCRRPCHDIRGVHRPFRPNHHRAGCYRRAHGYLVFRLKTVRNTEVGPARQIR